MRKPSLFLAVLAAASLAGFAEAQCGAAAPAETDAFLKSIGIDPASEDAAAAAAEGPVRTTYDEDPVEFSLARFAADKRKNGMATFISTRGFIRRLKKDYEGTSIPKTRYDPLYLTGEERALVGRKFAEGLFKKKN